MSNGMLFCLEMHVKQPEHEHQGGPYTERWRILLEPQRHARMPNGDSLACKRCGVRDG